MRAGHTMQHALLPVALLLALANPAQAQALDGKTLFAKNCAACHQATGLGIQGAFPALKGNKFVQGEPGAVIATVLKGRGGMPTFAASLDDDKLALVISYARQSWGNQAGAITAQDVQAVRDVSATPEAHKPQAAPTNIH